MPTDLPPDLRAAVEMMAEATWKSRMKRLGSIVPDSTLDRAPREMWQTDVPDISAALRALVNAGFMVAKREPTQAMLTAARDWSYGAYGKPIGDVAARGCWRAMSTAATQKVET